MVAGTWEYWDPSYRLIVTPPAGAGELMDIVAVHGDRPTMTRGLSVRAVIVRGLTVRTVGWDPRCTDAVSVADIALVTKDVVTVTEPVVSPCGIYSVDGI